MVRFARFFVAAAVLAAGAGALAPAAAVPAPAPDPAPATIDLVSGAPVDGGSALLVGITPLGVAFHDGGLVVADGGATSLRRIDLATGSQSVLAGRGTDPTRDGAAAEIRVQPSHVWSGGTGDMIFTDRYNMVRRLSPDGTITTLAGGVPGGVDGDGIPAVGALVRGPGGVAVAADGRIVFADQDRVRAIELDGTISTVAGGGTASGPSADGGPATDADLTFVIGVAVASDGTVYFVDDPLVGKQGAVRRVSPDGTLGTVTSGLYAPRSLTRTPDDHLYLALPFEQQVVLLDPAVPGGAPQVVIAAPEVDRPHATALDPATGRLAVADVGTNTVVLVDPDGTVTTVAGNGHPAYTGEGVAVADAQVQSPNDVTVGPDGATYIADSGNQRIRRVDPDGTVTTVAGSGRAGVAGEGGPATEAELWYPLAVAVGRDGTVYFTDNGANGRVLRVDRDGTLRRIAGFGLAMSTAPIVSPATDAHLELPLGLVVAPDGSLYFSERDGDRVRRLLPDGTLVTVAGTGEAGSGGDGGLAILARLHGPGGLALDGAGNLYVADVGNGQVRVVSPLGLISEVVDEDNLPGRLGPTWNPMDVTLDRQGNLIVAANIGRILRMRRDGSAAEVLAGAGNPGPDGDGGPALLASVSPMSVAVQPDGTILFSDIFSDRIRAISGVAPVDGLPPSLLPGPPLQVGVEVSPGRATVEWEAAIDGDAPVLGYLVTASVAGRVVAWHTVEPEERSVALIGLGAGIAHQIRVSTLNVHGAGDAVALLTTPLAAVPVPASPPGSAVVVAGRGFATVTWEPPAEDGGAPVLAYSVVAVERATGRLAAWLAFPADVRSASVPRLRNGFAHDVHVLAWTAAGPGAAATARVIPTLSAPSATTPAAPVSVTTEHAGDDAVVRWAPGADGGSPITGYAIVAVRGGALAGLAFTKADARSVTLPDVGTATGLQVYVVAANAVGAGAAAQPS